MESGQLFFAFLALIVFFLVLVGGAKEKPERFAAAGGAAGGGPVIVRTGGTKFPKIMKIAVKPNWYGNSKIEDFAAGAGNVLLFPLKMLAGFFRRRTD